MEVEYCEIFSVQLCPSFFPVVHNKTREVGYLSLVSLKVLSGEPLPYAVRPRDYPFNRLKLGSKWRTTITLKPFEITRSRRRGHFFLVRNPLITVVIYFNISILRIPVIYKSLYLDVFPTWFV